jgi:hypothetical protein
MVTELQYLLRTARALLPAFPEKAEGFVVRAASLTVDPRLRFLITPGLAAIDRGDAAAARKWLERACAYQEQRLARARAP